MDRTHALLTALVDQNQAQWVEYYDSLGADGRDELFAWIQRPPDDLRQAPPQILRRIVALARSGLAVVEMQWRGRQEGGGE